MRHGSRLATASSEEREKGRESNDDRAEDDQEEDGVLEVAKQLGNVARACRIIGYSRDSFYRFKELTAADLLNDRGLPLCEVRNPRDAAPAPRHPGGER
jgi:hypothetical protein